MKKVERSDLLGLGAYEEIRERFRARIIAEKKRRRFHPCAELSVVFENTDTVLFQVQEMLRTERITSESAIAHELETYNELVPGEGELSATMFVEIPERETRERRLVELSGLENTLSIEWRGATVPARTESRSVQDGQTTAVHYLRFPLGPAGVSALVESAARRTEELFFVVKHPALSVRAALPAEVVASLVADLPSQ
jgi:hypothetical protein